jgi:hypothetical protein
VLLVGEVDVVEEGALTRKESASKFQRLCVPELALFLLIWRVVGLVFLHLDDEADLGGVAKVGNGEAANFLNERLSSQLHFILTLLNQVLYFVWLQLHDASNTQF